MSNIQDDKIAEAIDQGIKNYWPEDCQGVLTHWLVVAAVINPDGETSIATYVPDDQPLWQTAGLVHYADVRMTKQISEP